MAHVFGNAHAFIKFQDTDGNTYEIEIPKVDLELEPVIEHGEMYGDPLSLYAISPSYISHMLLSGKAYRDPKSDSIMTIKLIKEGKKKKRK